MESGGEWGTGASLQYQDAYVPDLGRYFRAKEAGKFLPSFSKMVHTRLVMMMIQ